MPVDEFIVEGGRVEAGIAIEKELEADVCMLVLQGLLQGQSVVRLQGIYMRQPGVLTRRDQCLPRSSSHAHIQVIEILSGLRLALVPPRSLRDDYRRLPQIEKRQRVPEGRHGVVRLREEFGFDELPPLSSVLVLEDHNSLVGAEVPEESRRIL